MSADYGCRRFFLWRNWGGWWGNGFMNIFVLKLYFRLKIYFKKCKFHFQLAFFKGEDCSELRFAWKYDALPSTIEEQFPCRVCTRHVKHIVPCGLLDWLLRIGRITKFIWQYFRDEILPSTRNSRLFPFGGTEANHWRYKWATQMKGPQTR